jgi:hypothetical protein
MIAYVFRRAGPFRPKKPQVQKVRSGDESYAPAMGSQTKSSDPI